MKQLVTLTIAGLFLISCGQNSKPSDLSTSVTKPSKPRSFHDIANEDIEQLKEIYDHDKSHTHAGNVSSIEEILSEVAVFQEISDKLHSALIPDSSGSLKAQLQKQLIKTQVKEFPLLRKKYVEFAAAKMWENDITVTGSGTNINFVASYFATNKNIKAAQEAIGSTLEKLRFKRTTYRWYKGASEYQYYDIESKKDTDL